MKKRGGGVLGKLLTLVLLAAAAGFVYLLYYTSMVPMKYLILVSTAALILVIVVGILMWNLYHKFRFLLGFLLWFVLLVVFVVGGMYVYRTRNTLSELTNVETELSQVGVYVRYGEQNSDFYSQGGSYTYGIMSNLDRTNTDKAVEQLSKKLGGQIKVQEYAGLQELVEGLLREEVDAIILNQAYVDIMKEVEGYSSIDTMIAAVETENVETAIERSTSAVASGRKLTGSSSSAPGAVTADERTYTIYISGIDNVGGIVAKSRSDVNIIATANLDTKQLLLVSTPRDYFVPLSISGGVPDKLTHAGIYGIDVCMDTLGMLYDTDIHYYVRMNFSGFENIINALGGVEVYSDYEFDSKNILGQHYNQGYNYMNGESALIFARERFSFAEGDRQRGKNQMAVIEAVINKAASSELLTNYSSILASLEGSFETNISYTLIAEILQEQLSTGLDWEIFMYSVNGTGDTQKPYSMSQAAYVMIPDQATVEKAKTLMGSVRSGQHISAADLNE